MHDPQNNYVIDGVECVPNGAGGHIVGGELERRADGSIHRVGENIALTRGTVEMAVKLFKSGKHKPGLGAERQAQREADMTNVQGRR